MSEEEGIVFMFAAACAFVLIGLAILVYTLRNWDGE